MKKQLTSSAIILALSAAGATLPLTKAAAGSNAGAAIVGALIGGAIVAGANQNRRNTSTASSAQRTENRAVQSALNFFEFPAGTPDGVFGRNTRTAISNYQAFMDFPITGELSSFQKEFLLNSHQRAELGGAETSRIILTDPMGSRALLVSFMQQQQGGGSTLGSPLGGGTLQANAPANDFGSSTSATNPAGLPVFVTSQEPSMNELCISGIQPNSVEAQFCNLRAYAIDEGDRLASSVQGTTRADIQAQCEGFAPTLEPYINRVALSNASSAKSDLMSWVAVSGASASSLEGIAKVCLGIGYSTDNSDVALASVLTLVGLGQSGYQELLAYHLAMGFGFEGKASPDRGAEWLDDASLAFASGQEAITGESGAVRASVAVTLANVMRGMPTAAPADGGVMPAFAPTDDTAAEVGGGFFSSGASN